MFKNALFHLRRRLLVRGSVTALATACLGGAGAFAADPDKCFRDRRDRHEKGWNNDRIETGRLARVRQWQHRTRPMRSIWLDAREDQREGRVESRAKEA